MWRDYDVILLVFYIDPIVMRIFGWGLGHTNYIAVGGLPQGDCALAELQNETLAVYQHGGEDF